MIATHRGDSWEPGFPGALLRYMKRPLLTPRGLRWIPGLGLRLVLLGGVGASSLASIVWTAAPSDEIAFSPLVAELAPSLALPISVNERVEGWMERYLTDQRPVFEKYLAREGLYSEMIREGLRARGMPEELVYLAAIESAFTPGATSRVSASGMWQFMGPTAQQFGLRIDEYVDERRDPVRATNAALDYLQSLHGQFGSWYLAAAAYNAGPGRVARALKAHAGDEAGEKDLYWEIIDRLPKETRAYVPKMLALIILGDAAEDYGFHVKPSRPVEYERVWAPAGTTLNWVAKAAGTSLAEVRQLNPHLIRDVTPPGGLFPVRIPKGSSPMVVAARGGRWRSVAVDD